MTDDVLIPWLRDRGLIVDQALDFSTGIVCEPVARLIGTVTVKNCIIGAFSYVSPQTALVSTILGRYCSIGAKCTIGPTQHPVDWLTTSPVPYKDVFNLGAAARVSENHDEMKPVTIGNDVWIGTAAAVMGGVTVGDGSIIAYGSVVTRDVEPYSVVGGAPARLIRPRFKPAVVARLLAEPWWRYDLVRTTHPIPWRDPMAALDAIAEGVASGAIHEIPSLRHRITRNGTQYSCEKIA